MGYYEFKIIVTSDAEEALIEKTAAMGSLGSVLDDGQLLVYFPDVLGIKELVSELTSFRAVLERAGLPGGFSFDYVFISERDWNESWKKKFQPLDLGDRLTIIPPWETEREGRINLIIDPGMAFGTGHHETTTRCLALIEHFASGTPNTLDQGMSMRKDAFLDIGTGSGILAIAASKMGFRKVLGVDIDPLAVDAAQRNVLQNGLDNVRILEGSVTEAEGSHDFIAANLLSEILIALAPDIVTRLNPDGILVASGMIEGQEGDVIRRTNSAGLNPCAQYLDGRWVTVVFRR
jgi:ribosomal protein L11 methyltransferase